MKPDEILSRGLFALVVTISMLYRAHKKRSLDRSGCVAAFFVGSIISLSSVSHLAALFAFFFGSSRATKFRQHVKRKIDADFKTDGQRNATQVLCNGLIPTVLAVGYIHTCYDSHDPLGWHFVGSNSDAAIFYSIGLVSSLACCAGDTFASEIGTAMGNEKAFHVVQMFRRVPRGTNGAISLYGTLASLVGGWLVGTAFSLTQLVMAMVQGEERGGEGGGIVSQYICIHLICAFSGLVGSMLDSILGGTLQYSGLNKKTNKITQNQDEKDERGLNCVEHISGFNLLTNSQVNFISSFVISLTVPLISVKWL